MSKKSVVKGIPKSFKLFGNTYTVVFDDVKTNSENIFGNVDYIANKITLSRNLHGRQVNEDMQFNVFIHEITHLIFERLGEHKLANNEKLIELFSNCLHQVLSTLEYDYGNTSENK
jgi:hypothetical protein